MSTADIQTKRSVLRVFNPSFPFCWIKYSNFEISRFTQSGCEDIRSSKNVGKDFLWLKIRSNKNIRQTVIANLYIIKQKKNIFNFISVDELKSQRFLIIRLFSLSLLKLFKILLFIIQSWTRTLLSTDKKTLSLNSANSIFYLVKKDLFCKNIENFEFSN